MLTVVRNRLLLAIPTLLAVSLVTFFLGYFAPSSPVDVLLGQHGDPETRRRLTHDLGLDRPALTQYGDFLWHALHGDLGRSIANAGRPVTEMLAEQFPATALLATLALVVALVLGIPAGCLAALKHNGLVDRSVMAYVLIFVSLPPFVLAPILVLVFALWLGWLPASGWDDPACLILPVLVLAARPAALIARLMRSSMLDVIRQDYIRTALAKGLSYGQVLRRHALKNAFLPVLTVVGNTFGYLLTGSFVVETIFNIPGLGFESIQSIRQRDYPVIQGMALLVAALFIGVNLVVDLLYGFIDPRVRHEGSAR